MIEMLMSYKKYSAEDFMQWYLDNELCDKMNLPITLYEKYNLRDPEVFMQDLEWFVKSIQKAIFKRIQAPPIVMLSKSCYGYDHRESQFAWESSLLYDSLKSKILEIER
jgi:NAD+ synthase (glutamine-hydrolysing)